MASVLTATRFAFKWHRRVEVIRRYSNQVDQEIVHWQMLRVVWMQTAIKCVNVSVINSWYLSPTPNYSIVLKGFFFFLSLVFLQANKTHSLINLPFRLYLADDVIHKLQEDLINVEIILRTRLAEAHSTYSRGKLQPTRSRSQKKKTPIKRQKYPQWDQNKADICPLVPTLMAELSL